MPTPNNFVGKRIGNNRVELVAILGEGSYGCVYRGILHEDGTQKPCAVKCLAKADLDAYHLMCQRREIVLHKQVSDGQGIVSLYEAFEDCDYQWIIMEYCADGDLWEGIAGGQYSHKNDRIRDIFGQVLQAVEYCHSKHVFHRDLKPENVLLSDGGRKVLLADFGLASGSTISNELRCGSPWYMSPECWGGIFGTNQPYATAPNDVWCLGVLLINIVCGRHAPWRHATPQDTFFRDYMKQPAMLRLLLPLSSQVHDLLARVFTLTPSARISIQDFRTAILQIKCFAIPSAMRADFHDNQRAAWSTALGPTLSHPQSTEIIRIVPIVSSSPTPSLEEEEGVDITDAAKDYYKPAIQKKPNSFIRNIPIIDTRPQALRAATAAGSRGSSASSAFRTSSSTSTFADSIGPVTPQMAATVMDVEVLDISASSEYVILSRPASPLAKLADASVSTVTVPFQNILRAIGAFK